jgi:hypothetical protein
MDFCLWWVLCVVRQRSLGRVDHSSRGVLPSVVCLSLIVKPRQWGGPGPLGAVAPYKKLQQIFIHKLGFLNTVLWTPCVLFRLHSLPILPQSVFHQSVIIYLGTGQWSGCLHFPYKRPHIKSKQVT